MAYNVNNPINSRITSIGGHTYPSSQSVTSDISLTVPEEGNTNDVEHVLPAFNNGVSETINAKRKEAEKINDNIVERSVDLSGNIIELAKLLKKMLDDKLYKELGFDNFEQYCEEKADISYRHAHRYISILENISPENLTTLSGLSMSKLMKIATLKPDEQNDLIANNDLNSMSVRKLEKIIKEKTHTQKANSNGGDKPFVNELGNDIPKRLKALSGKLKSSEFENNDSINQCIRTIADAVAQLEKLMQNDAR